MSNVLFENVAQEGFNAGYKKGHKEGYMKGRLRGHKEGNHKGYKAGQGQAQFLNHMLTDSPVDLTKHADTLRQHFSQEAIKTVAFSFYHGLSLENQIAFMRDTLIASAQQSPELIAGVTTLLQKNGEQGIN